MTSIIQIDDIPCEVTRKRVRNVTISVRPPDGTVRVSVPLRMSLDAVRTTIAGRLVWIRKHREKMARRERPALPNFLAGEILRLWGEPCRLNVVPYEGQPAVYRCGETVELRVPPGSTTLSREALLYDWYRSCLEERLPGLIAAGEELVGVTASSWGIRRMKTRWGSCSIGLRRIWLNLELVKLPQRCLEFIIVHELTHLLEPGHNSAFKAHMDRAMPFWRECERELKQCSP